LPYLFPKELGQANHAHTAKAYAKQAKEHQQKQGNVGNDRGDETESVGLGVVILTCEFFGCPRSTSLQIR
jgi:hypothetical protein